MWALAPKDLQYVRNVYLDAIVMAGGQPVLLPMTNRPEFIRQNLDMCDGILFSGGADLDAATYGEEHKSQFAPVKLRDEFELELMRLCLEEDKPFFAICRGMQVLNVLKGGSLYQDIPTELPGKLEHVKLTDDQEFVDVRHTVFVEDNTLLKDILNTDTLSVNTIHHQAIKKVGDELIVNSVCEDGIIEGIELTNKKFALGVQWHPERMAATDEKSFALFKAFIESAKEK